MIGVYGQKDLNISIMACWGADQAKYFPRLRQDKVKYYFDKNMRLENIKYWDTVLSFILS